jgi:hypothetical protein
MERLVAEGGDVSGDAALARGDHRGGAAIVNVPAEQLSEELAGFRAIAASNFEMYDRLSH